MCAQAVVGLFSWLFFLCSVFISSQAPTTTTTTTTSPVTSVLCLSSWLLTGDQSWWDNQQCWVSMVWFCWCWGTQEVLLALPLCCSSDFSLSLLIRYMPIIFGSSAGKFLFQSWDSHQYAYMSRCLLQCMCSAFRCNAGCHILQWELNHCGLHHCSP